MGEQHELRSITVQAGPGGFGGPLTISPDTTRNKVAYITGGNQPEVATQIAELTGCELVDGFKTKVPDEKLACVIIDCGGTLRCGLYPKKGIPTINLMATGKSGPLAQYITEDIYVSGVKPEHVQLVDQPTEKKRERTDRPRTRSKFFPTQI